MAFSRVQDQDYAVRLLNNLLTQNRMPHALLFWGPEGVGKALTAIELAKILFCFSPLNGDCCEKCASCTRVNSGNHPDISIVSPLKKSRTISVETLEEIQESAALSPLEGNKKIFIILEADRLSVAAQHKFLKTLEEPPGNCIFILTTEYPRMLLQTILSRCQVVRFGRLRTETVANIIARTRDIPREMALAISSLSQGQVSIALDLIDTEKRAVALSIIQKVKSGVDALEISRDFSQLLSDQRKRIEAEIDSDLAEPEGTDYSAENKENLKEEKMAALDAAYRRTLLQYLYLLETWFRDELVYKVTADVSHLFNRDLVDELVKIPSKNPKACIEAIEKARNYLDRQMNEERVFRSLFLDLTYS